MPAEYIFRPIPCAELVVNETVVRNLGIKTVQDAIGRKIVVDGKTCPIVGVVKDFHVNSLRDAIGPVVLTTLKESYGLTNIKINLNQAQSVIQSMQRIWNKISQIMFLNIIFSTSPWRIIINRKTSSRSYIKYSLASRFLYSCLGLYGLVAFMAVQRKKEIGIRKVLGAPVRDIVVMLSKEFTVLIIIAFLIASPVAWYYMHQWLEQYAYRITIDIWFFAGTIVCALAIAWLTVGYTAIKAAIANPVNSLRTE